MRCNENVDKSDSSSCAAKKDQLRESFCSQETVNQQDCNGLDEIEYGVSDYCKSSSNVVRRLSSGTMSDHEFRMLFNQDSPALPMGERECNVLQENLGASDCAFGTMDSNGRFEPYEVASGGEYILGLPPLLFGLIIAGSVVLLVVLGLMFRQCIRGESKQAIPQSSPPSEVEVPSEAEVSSDDETRGLNAV